MVQKCQQLLDVTHHKKSFCCCDVRHLKFVLYHCRGSGGKFEKVKGGSKQVDNQSDKGPQLSLGNKYTALQGGTDWRPCSRRFVIGLYIKPRNVIGLWLKTMVLLEGNQTTWSDQVAQGGMAGWHYDEQGFVVWIYPKTDQQLWHGYFLRNYDQNFRKKYRKVWKELFPGNILGAQNCPKSSCKNMCRKYLIQV